MTPSRVFVLQSAERCGTNFLLSALNETGLAGIGEEWVRPDAKTMRSARSHSEVMEQIFNIATTPNGICAVKLFGWHHLEFRNRFGQDFLALMGSVAPLTLVRLTRHDKLGQAISMARALDTGVWRIDRDGEERHKPVYDRSKILHCLGRVVRADAYWDSYNALHGFAPLELFYEDLQHDLAGHVMRVADVLGIALEPADVPTAVTEQQRDAINDEWRQRFISETGQVQPEDVAFGRPNTRTLRSFFQFMRKELMRKDAI